MNITFGSQLGTVFGAEIENGVVTITSGDKRLVNRFDTGRNWSFPDDALEFLERVETERPPSWAYEL